MRAITSQGHDIFRFDTSEFPSRSTLRLCLDSVDEKTWLRTNRRSLNLDEVTSVWYRHPTPFETVEGPSELVRGFIVDECRAALGGALRTINCTWVNHPERIVSADYKPYQLALARRLGFKVPPTLITNDPKEARQFYEDSKGPVIYKTLTQAGFPSGEDLKLVYTSVVSDEDMESVERVSHAPCLFQRLIPKAYELRITVIGRDVFVAEIHSQESERARIDFRLAYDELAYDYHSLPAEVENRIRHLMLELDLQFGAIDMIVTPDGEYVFLEINPAGQFGWLEDELEFPMTEAFVRLLTGDPNQILSSSS